MKKIFIVPNPNKDSNYTVTKNTAAILYECGAEISMQSVHKKSAIPYCNYTEGFTADSELVIVIGGDGSFIDAASFAQAADIPILGVNLGKVGYLSEIEPDELDSLKKIFTGEYNIVKKMILTATVNDGKEEIRIDRNAVNDIVISHPEYLGIADFVVYSKEGGVRYRADGAVISTPQGSTAYSLSAGGPIVSHDAGAIILTPIAPHSFFNRSIVFGENEEIKIKNTSEMPLNLSIDGRLFYKIKPNDKCTVKASKKQLKVLTFKDNNMFSNLFSKMQILEDII